MSKKLIISATGYPGTTKSWTFTQEVVKEDMLAIAKSIGDAVIISGVEIDGSIVSAGEIIYNGEFFVFEGGTYNATVSIIETVENVPYNTDINDDSVLDSLPAYTTRIAKCGTGLPNTATTFAFEDLVRIKTLKELSLLEPATQTEVNANESSKYVTGNTLNGRTATASRRGVSKLATSSAIIAGTNATDTVTPKALRDAGIKPFVVTSGAILCSGSIGYVYPPSGYTMSDLKGFVKSINAIYFAGNVDGDDTLRCYHQEESTRVKVICYNSEQRAEPIFNYLAVWHK